MRSPGTDCHTGAVNMALAPTGMIGDQAEELEAADKAHNDPWVPAALLLEFGMQLPCEIDGRWNEGQFGSCCDKNRRENQMPMILAVDRTVNCAVHDDKLECWFPEVASSGALVAQQLMERRTWPNLCSRYIQKNCCTTRLEETMRLRILFLLLQVETYMRARTTMGQPGLGSGPVISMAAPALRLDLVRQMSIRAGLNTARRFVS